MVSKKGNIAKQWLSGLFAVCILCSGQPAAAIQTKMMGINGTYSVDGYVDDAQDLGAGWMRVESWGDNATYDSVTATLDRTRTRNIQVLPLVNNYTVSWVTSQGKQDWVDHIVHHATTYAKGGTYWQDKPIDLGSPVIEVGNEVYLSGNGRPDNEWLFPEEYAKMLKAAALAVNAATNNKVKLLASVNFEYDRDGIGSYENWADDMRSGAPDIESLLAGVVAHPYGEVPAAGIGSSTDANYSHQILYSIHDQWSLPVYVTEVGQKGPVVGFNKQADALTYYYLTELKNLDWLKAVFWYNQKDYGVFDINGDNGWALIDNVETRQLAWTAFQSASAYFRKVTLVENGDGTKQATVSDSESFPLTDYTVDNQETLTVNGDLGNVSVASGGTLKGSGNIKDATIQSGGKLAPGNSPGCLATTDTTITGTFTAEIGGTTACTGYDQLQVTGTATLGGSLEVVRYNNFIPTIGQTYTIIGTTNPVSGTFNGLAEGSTYTNDGVSYSVSYAGNNVTLTVLSVTATSTPASSTPPAAPNTGTRLFHVQPITIFVVATFCAASLFLLSRRLRSHNQ